MSCTTPVPYRAPVPSVLRILIVLVLDTIALFLLADVMPGFEIQTWAAALGMATVLGVLNALVWPVLARFTLDRKSTRLNSSHAITSRMPSSA